MNILESSITEVLAMLEGVPEFEVPPTLKKANERIGGRPYLALTAVDKGQTLGSKLGYQIEDRIFYSWVGGVSPSARRKGGAQALLDYQEDWVRRNGFESIRVKSMNQYPDMMRFLIRNKYEIHGIEGTCPQKLKVLFQKRVARPQPKAQTSHD